MKMSVTDVCRLCPNTANLLFIFDERKSSDKNMKEVVYVTTGIEIDEKDAVSQKLCVKCFNLTLKIFSFRKNALLHDKALKEKYHQLLQNNRLKDTNKGIALEPMGNVKNTEKQEIFKPITVVHPTVNNLLKKHPKITVPTDCFSLNISPMVCFKFGEVENYFKSRNLNMYNFISTPKKPVRKKTTHKSTNRRPSVNTNNRPSDKQITIQSLDTPPNPEPINTRKRRSSATNDQSDVVKKPAFIHSLGLIPVTPIATLLSICDKTSPLLTCRVCDSMHSNAKELKHHMVQHLVCQFCKIRFKSLITKNDHVENDCLVKKSMTNLPTVFLEDVRFDRKIRENYPGAFFTHRPFCHPTKIISEEKHPSESVVVDNNVIQTNQVPATREKQHESVSIVKPDIRIKNNDVLTRLAASAMESDVIKQLATLTGPVEVGTTESTTQTDVQLVNDIALNTTTMTAELKNLKPQLKYFKIPVIIKHGNFDVTYGCSKVENLKKKLCFWGDLPQIDVDTSINGNSVFVNNSVDIPGQTDRKNDNMVVGDSFSSPVTRRAVGKTVQRSTIRVKRVWELQ